MRLWDWFKKRFLAGLLTVVPLIVTVLVLRLLYNNLNGLLSPWLDEFLGRHIPGLGLLATLVIVLLAGLLAANFLGRRLIALGDALLRRLPLVRAVYRTSHEIISAVALPRNQKLREPVMIEYPRAGAWGYGFVTAHFQRETDTGIEEMANVYLPNPPVPTSGNLVAVPSSELYYLDVTDEQAMKLIVSGGMVVPPLISRRTAAAPSGDVHPQSSDSSAS